MIELLDIAQIGGGPAPPSQIVMYILGAYIMDICWMTLSQPWKGGTNSQQRKMLPEIT